MRSICCIKLKRYLGINLEIKSEKGREKWPEGAESWRGRRRMKREVVDEGEAVFFEENCWWRIDDNEENEENDVDEDEFDEGENTASAKKKMV